MLTLLLIFLLLCLYSFAFPIILGRFARTYRKLFSTCESQPFLPSYILPTVSVLVPVCGHADLLTDKLLNLAATTFPHDRMQVLLILDGKVQGIQEALDNYHLRVEKPLQLLTIQCERIGKNSALTLGVEKAQGDILFFTDSDVLLAPDAITQLVTAILPEDIGGGCGHHQIRADKGAQSIYWDLEARIKADEMVLLGKVTASYGTIMAIKRSLFQPIRPGVTDDLNLALSIVAQKKRFIYTDKAVADMEKPSRDPHDEIQRRRRIVCQSLYCLSLWPQLLNPIRWGWFSICLISHKLLRRLTPLFLIMIFMAGAVLTARGNLIGQLTLASMVTGITFSTFSLTTTNTFNNLHYTVRVPAYFLAVNLGMLLGCIDFIRGRRIVMW